jgi:hypothetical protein
MANKYKWNDWEKFLDEFAPIWGQCKNLRGNICKNPIFA